MKKLAVAVIGTGQIAGGYDQAQLDQNGRGVFTHAGAYSKSGKFILETVCDVNKQRVAAFQDHWGVAKKVNRIEEIYSVFHDVVSVCTPDETHYSIVKSLIEAKCCKCIFVEKPIAQTLEQIEEIIELMQGPAWLSCQWHPEYDWRDSTPSFAILGRFKIF